jgi:hypothetical protein
MRKGPRVESQPVVHALIRADEGSNKLLQPAHVVCCGESTRIKA